MVKPFSIQAPEQVAKEYGGNKQKIAEAAQMGIVDPTAAVLAGMFIDKMRAAAQTEAVPQQTIAQQVLGGAPPQQPQQPQQAPQGAPAGLGATPQAAPPSASAPMGTPPQGMAEGGMVGGDYNPPYMAAGGLTDAPIPAGMFDEPDNGGYAGGGIIAFADGGMTDLYDDVEMAESGGNQNAVSPKGASGVMQLMPGTMRNPGFGVPTVAELMAKGLSAEQANRQAGQKYLDAMLRKYGNKTHALMAYNWGPGNMDKWLASGANMNKVPKETLNYVKKVMGGTAQPGATPSAGPNAPWAESLESKVPGAYKYAEDFYTKNIPAPKNEGLSALTAEARKTLDPAEQKKRRNEDKWMALAEIGFNMAGTNSPYLLQAVGQAAAAALPGARAAKKEREADKRQAIRDLAEAEGITYKQALDKANYIREVANQKLEISDKDIGRKFTQQQTVYQQSEETKRTGMQGEAQRDVAQTNADSYKNYGIQQNEQLKKQAALKAPEEARARSVNSPEYITARDAGNTAEMNRILKQLANDYYFEVTGENLPSIKPPASGNAGKPAANQGPKEGDTGKAANGRSMVFQGGRWVYTS